MRQSYFHFVIVGIIVCDLHSALKKSAKKSKIGQEVSGCAYLILYTSKITFSRFRIQIDDHILWNLEFKTFLYF